MADILGCAAAGASLIMAAAKKKTTAQTRLKSTVKKPLAGKVLPKRQSRAAVRQNLAPILVELQRLYPAVDCALDHDSALQLLVATILSAQCTDQRVNLVTPDLFERYPGAEELAAAEPEELERLIFSTGFYRNKARNLKAMAQALVESHGGKVPRTMEELLALAGVARKTANVVLGTAFGITAGVVVDTHVARLARRLGWTRHDGPVQIERDLMQLLPRELWIWISHALIWHGRGVCEARRPRCERCSLRAHCPSAGLFPPAPGSKQLPESTE